MDEVHAARCACILHGGLQLAGEFKASHALQGGHPFHLVDRRLDKGEAVAAADNGGARLFQFVSAVTQSQFHECKGPLFLVGCGLLQLQTVVVQSRQHLLAVGQGAHIGLDAGAPLAQLHPAFDVERLLSVGRQCCCYQKHA